MFNDDSISKHYRELEQERQKALAEPCPIPLVGQRVLVNAMLVGKGHKWRPLEAVVLDICGDDYHVEYTTYKSFNETGPCREWINSVCLRGVIDGTE